MKKKELKETTNIRMFETRQEENLKKIYLIENQESKDFSLTKQSSHGGAHLPYGGGTLPKHSPAHGRNGGFSHQKQRSWDLLDTADELRVTNAVPNYATYRRGTGNETGNNHFQSDQIEKMAAISSPNLVRATMHMRGELSTNQKPLLVQTKSQGMFYFSLDFSLDFILVLV